jgi:hypothetical protein
MRYIGINNVYNVKQVEKIIDYYETLGFDPNFVKIQICVQFAGDVNMKWQLNDLSRVFLKDERIFNTIKYQTSSPQHLCHDLLKIIDNIPDLDGFNLTKPDPQQLATFWSINKNYNFQIKLPYTSLLQDFTAYEFCQPIIELDHFVFYNMFGSKILNFFKEQIGLDRVIINHGACTYIHFVEVFDTHLSFNMCNKEIDKALDFMLKVSEYW